MTIYSPAGAWIVVGGYDLTPDTFVLNDDVENLSEEVHSIGPANNWERLIAIDLSRVTLEANGGLYDDAVGRNVEALQSKVGTEQLLAYGMAGLGHGSGCALVSGALICYWKRIAQRDALTKANAEYKVTGFHKRARLVHGFVTETSDPGNTEGADNLDQNANNLARYRRITNASVANPTVLTSADHGLITGDVVMISGSTTTPTIDGERIVTVVDSSTYTVPVNVSSGGAQTNCNSRKLTSTGGTADLHVLALTLGGYTNVVVKVRHSTDDVTYSDLATFTSVTLVNQNFRQTIAGTINRYTAVSWDFTGAGSGQSIRFIVALARNN